MNTLISNIVTDGASKLHIVTDFDRTLTQAFVDGEYKSSLISTLYEEGYLSEHYQKTAQGYFDKYYPIEQDESRSREERSELMKERWTIHKELLIKEGITKQHIYDAMDQSGVVLRKGAIEFFALCREKNIPVVIFSAGGLGVVAIERFLERDGLLADNIHIVSNDFVWDNEGNAIDFRKPIVHSLNKGEMVLSQYAFADSITSRPNILLLGDSLGDAHMADGSDCAHFLKVGFLNKDIEKKRGLYQETFDIVIEDDGDMSEINSILTDIAI